MQHVASKLFIAVLIILVTGCGLHLRHVTQIPTEMRKLVVSSNDPYGSFAQTVRQQLRINNVQLVDESAIHLQDLPILRLENETIRRDTASIFINGKTAEYQIMMTVNAQALVPGKSPYPISTSIYSSFFDNSQAALAKNSEQEIILQEMRERAASQLIRKLLTVSASQREQAEESTNVDSRVKK